MPSPKRAPRPQAVVYDLTPTEAALYAPAVALVLRPSGDPDAPSAVLDVLDANGTVLRRVLVNGVRVSTRTLPLLIEPRGDGYHGGPPSGYEASHKGEVKGHVYKYL